MKPDVPASDEKIRLDASPPPSRWPRRLLKLGGWSVGLGLLLLAALPWLLSTGPGNRLVVGVVNGQIPGTFSADRLSLGWLGGVGVSDGELIDPEGNVVFTGLSLRADDLGIMDAVRGSGFGELVLTVTELKVVQPSEGPSNLERALGLESGRSIGGAAESPDDAGDGGVALPVGLGVSLKLTAGRVSYVTVADDGARDETVLTDLDASADLRDATRVTAEATSRLERDEASGVIDADLALVDALDAEDRIDWRRGGVELNAKVLELPLAPMDRLLATDGLLTSALGERLSVEVSAAGTLAAPEAAVTARSALMGLEASLVRRGGAVEIEPGAALTWRLTPEAFAKLVAGGRTGGAGTVLREAVEIRLPIEALRLPVDASGAAIERASGRVEAGWTPISLTLADGRSVSLRDGTLRVDTEALGERISLVFAAETATAEADGPVRDGRMLLTASVLEVLPAASGESDAAAAGLGFDMSLERLPTALIEALASVEIPGGGLPRWLGEELSLDVESRLPASPDDPIRASGRVRSAGLSGPFAVSVRLDGSSGEISTPEPLVMRLEPAVLRDAMGPEVWDGLPVGLREAIEPKLTLHDLRWRLLPASPSDSQDEGSEVSAWQHTLARLDPGQTRGQIEWAVPSLRLQDHRQNRALPEFRDLRASLAVSALSRPIDLVAGVSFDGPPLPDSSRDADGGLTLRLSASELMDRDGVFAPLGGVFDLSVRGTAVPSAVVDAFADQEGKLAATLGPVIEPAVSARVRPGREASVEVDVTSTHAVGSVLLTEDLSDAVWRPELQEDPRFTLSISREAVESWMGGLHPVFADVVRSAPDAPATLSLDRSSFAFSEGGLFDLEGLRADATLDLGRLELERQGWLRQGLTGIIGYFAPSLRPRGSGRTYLAQFSPMQIRVRDGVIRTSELWLSAEDLGVGFAGTVDLKTNRIDMGVGVLGATFIAAASDFDKALEPLRVYELPLRGTITEPRLEYDKFLGQIAAAYGRQELERNAEDLGGWGRVIGILGDVVVDELFEWKNTRAWTPSSDAQAFAVRIAEPEPAAAETPDEVPAGADPESPPPAVEEREQDEVEQVLESILDIIGR